MPEGIERKLGHFMTSDQLRRSIGAVEKIDPLVDVAEQRRGIFRSFIAIEITTSPS